jgi:hypothetical protein
MDTPIREGMSRDFPLGLRPAPLWDRVQRDFNGTGRSATFLAKSRGDFLAMRVMVHDAPAKPLGSRKEMGELTRATTTPPPLSATPMPPARTIQMESHGIAIPAPTHEAGAGHLPYAHPHALQACRAKRHNRPGSTAPENLETSSWWHGGGMEEDG